jgi:arginyl-tRNA synthetase
MQNLLTELEHLFSIAAQKAFDLNLFKAEITQSTQDTFGHYQCNSALKLAKELKLNPRQVAQKMVDAIGSTPMLYKVEIAGPGFINLWIDSSFLSHELEEMVKDPKLGLPRLKNPKKIIVEFSSPNVAKELHVGHLRSTIIGESIARLFEFLGHDVLRLSHIGDWGTQFGMLIAFMKENHPEVFELDSSVSIEALMEWYREAKKLFDCNEAFKKRSQLEVIELQSGNPESLNAWKKICLISRIAYEEIYSLLNVKVLDRGESFYNPMLKDVIHRFVHLGLAEESEGAKCVFLDGFETMDKKPLPFIIQKSDGGYNYATTDLAAIMHRVTHEKADRIIHVVDSGQKLHFDMLFKAAQAAQIYDPNSLRIEHVGFGVVLGEDGKKFKTRSGETVKLIDLLLEAVRRAKVILKERMPDATHDEIERLSVALGTNAVKYADLSSHRLKDYVFSYDRMLKFEGNTAAFLIYSYVRILSIKAKSTFNLETLLEHPKITLEHSSEIALGIHLRQFAECLKGFEEELLPNHLCDYLFNLAEKFNGFFRDCRVIGEKEEPSRLLLCYLTERVFYEGLSILGLTAMHRM